jgi:hypothetical protein
MKCLTFYKRLFFNQKQMLLTFFLKSVVVSGFQDREYVILYCETFVISLFFLHKKQYACCFGSHRASVCDKC